MKGLKLLIKKNVLEIDTIIGKNHKGAIVTINDRASGYLWMEKITNRTAELVYEATVSLLSEKSL